MAKGAPGLARGKVMTALAELRGDQRDLKAGLRRWLLDTSRRG